MNQQNNKKMKIGKDSSFDPLGSFNEKSRENILQHLSGADVLNLSEVSLDWYKIIGKSSKAMDKIQLVIKENWSREFDFEVVENSERKYEHIKVSELLRSRKEVAKMLEKFADSIVSIDTRFDIEMNEVKLLNLKSLVISTRCSSSYVEGGIMTATSSLEELKLRGLTHFPGEIIGCLEKNTGLKELVLEDGAQTTLLANLTFEIGVGIQLKSLKIDSLDYPDEIINKFFSFLRTQIECIEDIKLLNCKYITMVSIFSNLKSLRRLTFAALHPYTFQNTQVKPNPSIRELNLISVNDLMLRSLLPKAPKLQKLYIADPTWKMFDFITFNSPSLRLFRYAYFENCNKTFVDAIAHYEQECEKYKNVNKNIAIAQV